MPRWAIADTGPLVSYFDRRDRHHAWSVEQMNTLQSPLLVNEPVLTEALYLLRRYPEATDALMDLVERGALRVAFHLGDQIAAIRALMSKYSDMPMSLADASIVRMAELNGRHAVLTFDSDFSVHRKYGHDPVPLITPLAK